MSDNVPCNNRIAYWVRWLIGVRVESEKRNGIWQVLPLQTPEPRGDQKPTNLLRNPQTSDLFYFFVSAFFWKEGPWLSSLSERGMLPPKRLRPIFHRIKKKYRSDSIAWSPFSWENTGDYGTFSLSLMHLYRVVMVRIEMEK